MSLDASAKNMQAVCKAKEHHDKTCPWGGKGTHVHLSWFDIERMGWEEGDVICGLIVVGDERVATGMMRVTCDAEPEDDEQRKIGDLFASFMDTERIEQLGAAPLADDLAAIDAIDSIPSLVRTITDLLRCRSIPTYCFPAYSDMRGLLESTVT